MSWLVIRGNQQMDWFACETRRIPDQPTVEEQLSALQLSTPSITRDIRSIIDEFLPLLCRASGTLFRKELLTDDCRAQIIDSYKKHNELLRRHLGDMSMSDINYAMYIRTLLASCEIFLSTFNDKTYEPAKRDYYDAMLCLKKLAAVIDSTGP